MRRIAPILPAVLVAALTFLASAVVAETPTIGTDFAWGFDADPLGRKGLVTSISMSRPF